MSTGKWRELRKRGPRPELQRRVSTPLLYLTTAIDQGQSLTGDTHGFTQPESIRLAAAMYYEI